MTYCQFIIVSSIFDINVFVKQLIHQLELMGLYHPRIWTVISFNGYKWHFVSIWSYVILCNNIPVQGVVYTSPSTPTAWCFQKEHKSSAVMDHIVEHGCRGYCGGVNGWLERLDYFIRRFVIAKKILFRWSRSVIKMLGTKKLKMWLWESCVNKLMSFLHLASKRAAPVL